MYNRYIPQPDGTFRRDRIQEAHTPRQQEPCVSADHCPKATCQNPQHRRPQRSHTLENQPGDFLKQLLPKGFDTGDLFVVLLLLLMAGDREEDRNNALLTLALYFIM